MDDETFTKLGLEASVCPKQRTWPKPDVEFRTEGDSIRAEGLHWCRNHEAADWLRDYAAKVLADVASIDADDRLSTVGKKDRKRRLAAQAKEDIQQSQALAQAKETSARQLAKWDQEFQSHLKEATTTHVAAVYSELWNRCYKMEGAERLAWLNKHATDPTFASSLLTAPTAITGLKSEELHFLREQFEKVVHPESAEDRPRTLEAQDDLECGARSAIKKICGAAGVKPGELGDVDTEPVGEAA